MENVISREDSCYNESWPPKDTNNEHSDYCFHDRHVNSTTFILFSASQKKQGLCQQLHIKETIGEHSF